MKPNRSLLLLTALMLLVSGCGGDEGSGTPGGDDDTLVVVATTSILGDVAEHIAGDHATIEVLMPAGTDPHEYSPSARDVEAITSADLVVANGLGLEESLEDVFDSAESSVTVLRVGDFVDPMPFGSEEDTDHAEEAGHEGHDHTGTDDPHFWQDPVRMIAAVEAISDALAEAAPDVDWETSAAAYEDELESLDAEVEQMLAPIPADQRILVTNHDAFGYFAARYDFTVAGVVIPGGSTLAEPSAADLADLVHTLADLGVHAIFVENIASPNLAETVAEELGSDVTIATLYTGSLGEAGGPADTYVGMIRTNAETIASALITEG